MSENQDRLADRRQALMECIDRLPEQSKQLLQMKYDQGLSFASMAEGLKRSIDSLKMALFRVRRACWNVRREDSVSWNSTNDSHSFGVYRQPDVNPEPTFPFTPGMLPFARFLEE